MILEAPVDTANDAGGFTRAHVALGAVWASFAWLGGEERERADRPEQAGRWRLSLRFRPGVTAGMRLRDGARLFEITATADPDGSRKRLICLCEEVSP
jgi:SPP1 family predicted phage head-tail adaptor